MNKSSKTNRLYRLLQGTILCTVTLFSACKKENAEIPAATNNPASINSLYAPLAERVILDTPYGTDPKQKMDIYLPAGRSSATKVIVMIHGGAWMGGDKVDMRTFVPMFKAKWPDAAVVNINYRLTSSPGITHLQIMNDIKAAVNLITANKNAFAVSDTLAMMGASAGGQLALLYTYTQNINNYVKCVADLYGPCIIDDWSWYNSYNIFLGMSVKDVLTKYNGATWEADPNIYFANSPIRRAQANSKPTIIFHGTIDVIVPLYQSQWLNARLNHLNVPHEYYEYFDGHGFNQTNNLNCIDKTVSFFKRNIK